MKLFHRLKPIVGSQAALALLTVALLSSVATACPTCKEAIAESDPHQQSMAAGYYYSILFMMSMPFAILGGFVGLAYISIRRACRLSDGNEEAGNDH